MTHANPRDTRANMATVTWKISLDVDPDVDIDVNVKADVDVDVVLDVYVAFG